MKLDDKLIVILDFEKIVSDISPETGLKVSDIDEYTGRGNSEAPIMIAEDSSLLMHLIVDSLERAGYTMDIFFTTKVSVYKYSTKCEWKRSMGEIK